MKYDESCRYCNKDAALDELAIKICDLSVSVLYLFREQTYHGRCILAHNEHYRELYALGDEELCAFMMDAKRASQALQDAFSPHKMNFGNFGDKAPHLHLHIVPKYEGGTDWGTPFELNPKKVYLTDDDYDKTIESIKAKLRL